MSRPLASLSLDLDNLWSYMKIHGDPGWQTRPSYLDAVVPYVLDVLERERLRITFFVVGADAAETRNHAALCVFDVSRKQALLDTPARYLAEVMGNLS